MLKSGLLTSCPCYIAKCYQIWDKIGFKIIKSKTEQFVWAKVWYHIGGSVLQIIKFDYVSGSSEIGFTVLIQSKLS